MISATGRRTALRDSAVMLMMFLSLWPGPRPAAAGELVEIPVVLRPGLTLPDLSGTQRNLDEFAGKVLLINFWASWCRPCIEEMPGIQRLIKAMGERPFVVIGVNVGEGERRVQAAVKRLHMHYPILLDKDSTEFNSWGGNVLPTAYVLDGSGRVRYLARGPVAWDRDDIIDRLMQLAEQPPHAK